MQGTTILGYKDQYPQTLFGDFSLDVIKGIKSNNKAFAFPQIVQLDLTNNCNLNCIGCWCHSDLMGDLKFNGEWKKKHLPKDVVLNLIKELAENGTREIQLSGSGDPMMYPYLMDVVSLIKTKGLILHLITNFTLVTKSIVREFVRLKVDRITISLWAGTPETYVKTHPNQNKKSFDKIIENLEYLNRIKELDKLPKVKIYNVISALNYHEIEEMVNFALKTNTDFIEFQVIDIVEDKTNSLSLNKEHVKEIMKQLRNIRTRDNYIVLDDEDKNEFVDFGRLYKDSLPKDFTVEKHKMKIRCPKGYISHNRKISTDTFLSIEFDFSQGICLTCDNKSSCYSVGYPFKLDFLRLLGFGSFYRRLQNIIENSSQKYDVNIVDTMPCYIGWTYVRILPNGDVIPCCKASKKPLGNINNNSFGEIWFSKKYNEFRYLAKSQKKSHPYFKVINCYKSCDNVGMNVETKIRLNMKNGIC